ncbi:MAG: type 2 lanthipeptide synthetase LanM family protein, partial [Myxococcota bacterium]
WLQDALARLGTALSRNELNVLERAQLSLLRALLRRLRFLTAPALARVCEDDGEGEISPATWRKVMERCPWLTALLTCCAEQWLENILTLCRRYQTDRVAIANMFGPCELTIFDFETGLGDPHDGGHTVARLQVREDFSLIYKPRSVRLEAFFSELLGWLSSDELRFKGLDVVECDTHGWVACLVPQPCLSEAALCRFHRRLGGLLALGQVFGATDLHEDNVFAQGEDPVLIDLETLITPDTITVGDLDRLQRSVFDVGMLPAWLPDGPQGEPRLSGAIGGGWDAQRGIDQNSLPRNLPRFGDTVVSPRNYREAIVDGFRTLWQHLCVHQGDLPRQCASIRQATYRVVLRPTVQYWRALVCGLQPDALASEADFRASLRAALRPLADLSNSQEIFEGELSTLAKLNIPCFTGLLDSSRVRLLGSEHIEVELGETPWQTLKARLSSLAGADVDRHSHCIVAALTAATEVAPPVQSLPRIDRHSGVSQDAERFLLAAQNIAIHIEEAALATAGGGVDWLQPRLWPLAQRWQLLRSGPSLGDGRAGIAVFLAAAARSMGEGRFGVLAQRALQWQRYARADVEDGSQALPSGGAVGVASLVYALVLCAQLLNESTLLEDALAWSKWIPTPRQGDDLGVFSGHAGNLLVLLALRSVTQDLRMRDALLERASALGDFLLESTRSQPHALTMQNPGQRGGFGYGPDGIAYALARLCRCTDDQRQERWLNAARDLLRATPSSPPAPNAAATEHDAALGICTGACGETLARLGVQECVDDVEAFRFIPEAWLEEGHQASFDHLCCGNAGIADTLLEVGRRGQRSEYVDKAALRVSTMLSRAATPASYRLMLAPGCQRFGLFDGLAGIGFGLLRHCDSTLPCVLVLDSLKRGF